MKTSAKRGEYTHLPLNVSMQVGAGSYWISGEDRIPFNGREVLCIIRDTDCITSCCGESAGFRSIGVLGYIVEWHARIKNGMPVSIVEPIADEEEKQQLARTLQKKYRITQVEFL
jgi:hypothetical protein